LAELVFLRFSQNSFPCDFVEECIPPSFFPTYRFYSEAG